MDSAVVKKIHKFLMWAEPEQKKTAVLPVSCTQPIGKVFLQTNGTDRKHIFERDAF